MQKQILSLFALLFISVNMSGQKVYSTQYDYQADVKVYVVDNEYLADLIVYRAKQEHELYNKKNCGYWFFTSQPYTADKKIYFVDRDYNADLKIYFTSNEYLAGWKNNEKKYLMYK